MRLLSPPAARRNSTILVQGRPVLVPAGETQALGLSRHGEEPVRLGDGRRPDGSVPVTAAPPRRIIRGVLRRALSDDWLRRGPTRFGRRQHYPPSRRVRYSRKEFIQNVLKAYPYSEQIDDETFVIPWAGDRTIYVSYNPQRKSAWIQFANNSFDDPEKVYASGPSLRRGSLDLFRSLKRLVAGFHRAGLNLEFEADRKHFKTYDPLLRRVGYEPAKVGRDSYLYRPVGLTQKQTGQVRQQPVDEDTQVPRLRRISTPTSTPTTRTPRRV